MLYRFRHRILGPVAVVWLLLTVASGVEQAVLWSGFSREQLNLSASLDETARRHLERARTMSAIAGFMAIGAGLFALYLVWTGYMQGQAQDELLGQKLRAEKTAGEKSDFLANMSHEIRTPMNAILGFGELLESERLTPKQAQYVRSIRQSGASLLQLINDVLDLSKFEAGRMELNFEPTDVKEFCGFLQTMFAQQAAIKTLALKFEIGDVPDAVLLDQLRLRQVLVNLVGNALKFTEKGFVRTRIDWEQTSEDRSQGTLLMEVEDTGVGISPEKQEEIFKPFVQSEPGRAGENEGTGLGLNIVQRMMELMGGTITLESTLGIGSVFRLRIPDVSVSARLPVSNLAKAEEEVDFDDFLPATLLVVDDNETNCKLVQAMFQKTHHTILTAHDGREALDSIREEKPTAVLLDIRMPAMDGLQTLAEIRKSPELELLPVIAVTASSRVSEEYDMADHFSAYLRKPFSQRALYKVLEEFMRNHDKTHAENRGRSNPPAESVPAAKRAADWEILLAELHILQLGEWGALSESLAINRTHAFARKLRLLAQQTQCPPLAAYAETLAGHAEAYAVHDLEVHLAAFPALLKMIEDQTKVTCG